MNYNVLKLIKVIQNPEGTQRSIGSKHLLSAATV